MSDRQPKRRILKEFELTEISGVDRPCQEPALVAIQKRAQEPTDFDDIVKKLPKDAKAKDYIHDFVNSSDKRFDGKSKQDRIRMALGAYYNKRAFSPEQRKKAAKSGAAMPDGSFPIKSVGDLHNAVHALGRAKNQSAAKAHIISRAKSLGAVSALPEDWDIEKIYIDDISARVATLQKRVAQAKKAADEGTTMNEDGETEENCPPEKKPVKKFWGIAARLAALEARRRLMALAGRKVASQGFLHEMAAHAVKQEAIRRGKRAGVTAGVLGGLGLVASRRKKQKQA